ncbi:MAG: hypothetical protein DIJKHBIC_04495 [Thermoanaerobaculia bacterium]|nr:hypothetical protein [Thermoanaerobaculia bacterium]
MRGAGSTPDRHRAASTAARIEFASARGADREPHEFVVGSRFRESKGLKLS